MAVGVRLEVNMSLTEEIQACMIEHAISQKILAEKIGISAHSLGRILNGKASPKPETQGRILKVIKELNQSDSTSPCSLKEATVEELLVELTSRGFKVTLSIASGDN